MLRTRETTNSSQKKLEVSGVVMMEDESNCDIDDFVVKAKTWLVSETDLQLLSLAVKFRVQGESVRFQKNGSDMSRDAVEQCKDPFVRMFSQAGEEIRIFCGGECFVGSNALVFDYLMKQDLEGVVLEKFLFEVDFWARLSWEQLCVVLDVCKKRGVPGLWHHFVLFLAPKIEESPPPRKFVDAFCCLLEDSGGTPSGLLRFVDDLDHLHEGSDTMLCFIWDACLPLWRGKWSPHLRELNEAATLCRGLMQLVWSNGMFNIGFVGDRSLNRVFLDVSEERSMDQMLIDSPLVIARILQEHDVRLPDEFTCPTPAACAALLSYHRIRVTEANELLLKRAKADDFVWRPHTHRYFGQVVKDQVFTILLVFRKLSPKMPRDIRELILHLCVRTH
jgi:hypothetical protein